MTRNAKIPSKDEEIIEFDLEKKELEERINELTKFCKEYEAEEKKRAEEKKELEDNANMYYKHWKGKIRKNNNQRKEIVELCKENTSLEKRLGVAERFIANREKDLIKLLKKRGDFFASGEDQIELINLIKKGEREIG